MKLVKLALSNIRSYRYQEIEFPEGATLLAGDVGSGKTTLLLAVEYALFGLQPGQRGTSLLANGEDEGKIILELEIEGKRIEIERVLRRTSKGVSQEECALVVNGERSEMAVTELKTRILDLLKYPSEFVKKTNVLYKYTVYSPQEEMKSIILEESEARLNLLRTIFGVEKYRRIKENSALITIRLREQGRILQAQVKGLESYEEKIRALSSALETADSELITKEREILAKKQIRKKVEQELIELKEKIAESLTLEKELEKANVQHSNKRVALSDAETELEKSRALIKNTGQTFDESEYKKTLSGIASQKSILGVLQREIIELSSNLKSIESRKSDELQKKNRIFKIDMCPTCLQDVSNTHKLNILNETESRITSWEKEKAILETALSEKSRLVGIAQEKVAMLESTKASLDISRARIDALAHTKKRVDDLEKMVISLKKDLAFLEEHMTGIKQALLEYAKFKTQVSLKEAEVRKAFGDEKSSEIQYAEKKKDHEFLVREKERLKQELQEKRAIQQRAVEIEKLETWIAGPFTELISLIERNVLIRVREEFSKRFNKWFGLLTTDAFSVQLDETFTPIILQKDFELDYSFLSGGERTAVALAYRLALNQILNSIHSNIKTRDLIILDEPTDGFSEQQLDKVRDILKEIKVAQLIIVSHEPKMESFVDNVIRLKKEGGYSTKV
ncbi:MAG: SMC family ATPase [Nanoarchaeota archaeon]